MYIIGKKNDKWLQLYYFLNLAKKENLKLNSYFSPQISPTKSRNWIYCEDLDMPYEKKK